MKTTELPQVVVSMTSFPQAITFAVKALQSLLDGSVLPDKLILYLTFSQFGEAGIPEELTRLAESNPVDKISDSSAGDKRHGIRHKQVIFFVRINV